MGLRNTPESSDGDLIADKLALAQKPIDEQIEFNGLSTDFKLKKLNDLVQKSQLFSKVIAEALFENTMRKKKEREKQENQDPNGSGEPPRKKGRKAKGKSKPKDDVLSLVSRNSNISAETQQTKRKIEEAQTHANRRQPRLITGCEMRDYQLDGMEWLISLYENGLNGILADEMGLGKTVQAISLIAFLIEQNIPGPFLVVCPLSTVGNWCNEFSKFAPTIDVLNYTGGKQHRAGLRTKYLQKNKFTVVVTSYEIAILDRAHLSKKRTWELLIVDEGHRLKNNDCLLIRELKKISTSNRLLITGTPLQNNLNELWSLLNFILPEIFHDVDLFNQYFNFEELKEMKNGNDEKTSKLITYEIEKTLITNLHTILKPFLLRRLKKVVVKNLPPKREYIIYGSLTSEQQLLYKAALNRNLKQVVFKKAFMDYMDINKIKIKKKTLEKFIDTKMQSLRSNENDIIDLTDESHEPPPGPESRVMRSDIYAEEAADLSETEIYLTEKWAEIQREVDNKKFQNLVMQLRLICDSPYLFNFPWENESDIDDKIIENSGKLQILDQILPKLLEKNHKVLIFSQFTKMLDLIHDWLEFKKLKVCRIDGDTSQLDRQKQIDNFGLGEYDVFLLSTRAGGLGINLTAADSVILFDSDWNPQVDLQAMDRVHRIGQHRPVVIYRLAITNTIEQVLLAKADSKRTLEKLVIQMGEFESLSKLMSQELTVAKKQVPKESDMLANELTRLLNTRSKDFKGNAVDNVLTDDELEELLDRSPEAYTRDGTTKEFKHISIFETVSSME